MEASIARLLLVSAMAAAVLLVVASPAAADGTIILVADDDHVQLSSGDNGQLAAAITLLNGTAEPVTPTVTPAPAAGTCGVRLKSAGGAVQPNRQSAIALEFLGCSDDKPFTFNVAAAGQNFTVFADPPKGATPNLWLLLAFPGAALVGGLLCQGARKKWVDPRGAREGGGDIALPGLSASWKFADSWAANATVLTALFAGLFGATEVTKAILGDQAAKDVLSISGIAAALSVGFAGLAPMVLQAMRKAFPEHEYKTSSTTTTTISDTGTPIVTDNDDGSVTTVDKGAYLTPAALVVAATLTIAGAAGQLFVLMWAVVSTDVSTYWPIALAGGGALGVLAVYAWKATTQNLDAGAVLPTDVNLLQYNSGRAQLPGAVL